MSIVGTAAVSAAATQKSRSTAVFNCGRAACQEQQAKRRIPIFFLHMTIQMVYYVLEVGAVSRPSLLAPQHLIDCTNDCCYVR